MARDKNEGKLYVLLDRSKEGWDADDKTQKKLAKRQADVDKIKKTKRGKGFKGHKVKDLKALGLCHTKHKDGKPRLTLEGRVVLGKAMEEEAREARRTGKPWPPYPEYFKDMRKLDGG